MYRTDTQVRVMVKIRTTPPVQNECIYRNSYVLEHLAKLEMNVLTSTSQDAFRPGQFLVGDRDGCRTACRSWKTPKMRFFYSYIINDIGITSRFLLKVYIVGYPS